MNYYELTYLVPVSAEPEIQALSEKIEAFFQEGKLDKKERPLKKNLAYPIEGETQAFLVSLFFYLNSESIEKIEEFLKKEKGILRYLLFKTKPYKEEKKRREKPVKKPSISRSSTKSKVEISDIDKKIEEILEE